MAFKPEDYLMKVKGGADYLEVKWRIVWFRESYPNGVINTELVSHTTEPAVDKNGEAFTLRTAVFKATVSFIGDDGTVAVGAGHGSEESTDFGDYLEKAETKAIGRALAALGFGTQFCEDHDFGADKGRVVDAPVKREAKGNAGGGEVFGCEQCGIVIKDSTTKAGNLFTAQAKAEISKKKYGQVLCWICQKAA